MTRTSLLVVTAISLAAPLAPFAYAQSAEGSAAPGASLHQAKMSSGDHRGKHHRGGHHRGGARMMGLMEAYDTDDDGSLTQDELTAARAAQLEEFDANGDGALDLAEYEKLWLQAMRERMVDRFQAHDDDGTGTITVEEFTEEFEGLVARADRNGDGVLNADDMGRAMGRRGPGGSDKAE